MHMDWTGSSSSDVVLRCYAPPLLSEPYRHVVSGWGRPTEQLSRRLGFVEILLRYLVAVYSAELGEGERCGSYSRLLEGVERASLGSWWAAAFALAKRVSERPDAVAPDLAGIFVDTFGGSKPSRSPAARMLQKLIEVRNVAVHSEGMSWPSDEEAQQLMDEIREPLRKVLHNLSALRGHPLLCIEDYPSPYLAKVLRFSPAGVDSFELPVIKPDIQKREPFLLSRGGDALMLGPWLRVETRESGCRAVLRNPRHDKDLKILRERLPRHDAVLRGIFSLPNAERLLGAFPGGGAPVIPGYEIDGPLGRGGAGSVWLARETRSTSTERVAIKVLHRAQLDDAQARERLIHEYRFLASRPHPAVVGARDQGESDSHGPFLVMEYIKGMDLESKLRQAPFDPDDAARIVSEVLDALADPHLQGHVHRDLKPANLILDPQGNVRIIDFGIAMVAGATRLTRTMQAVGTRDYMAPEQLAGGVVDGRTDIYALGRTLEDLVRGLVAGEERPALPPGILAVVRRATQEHPRDRFQTVKEMRVALDERGRIRWGGAPVLDHDQLSHNFGVRAARARFGDQAWLFEGLRLANGAPVGLLLATGGAGALLYAADAEIEREQRRALDYAGLYRTAEAGGHSFPFLVFEGLEELEDRIGELLGDSRYTMLTGKARRVLPKRTKAPPAPAPPPPQQASPVVPPPTLPAGQGGERAASAELVAQKDKDASDKTAKTAAAVIGVVAGGALAGLAGAIGGAVVGQQIAKSRKKSAKARNQQSGAGKPSSKRKPTPRRKG
jgi:hypothetical protein